MVRRIVQVARTLRLTELLRVIVRFLPARLQRAISVARINLRARLGEVDELHTVVPEAELEARFREVLRELKRANAGNGIGDYLEFGVYVGTSMACMHRALVQEALDDVRMFGFDSFEGLPPMTGDEDTASYGLWTRGQYRAPLQTARANLASKGVDMERVTLVKGWFEDTLTPELAERHRLDKAGVIMIDCDLYTSAKTALEFCAPLIRDRAVILFDEWFPATVAADNAGERRAFAEFLAAHPGLSATELESYAPDEAKVFMVSSVQVAADDPDFAHSYQSEVRSG